MTGLPDITVLQPKNPTNIIIETDNFVWRISSTFVRVEIVAHNELVGTPLYANKYKERK
jgi:hypothetical protein